MSKSAADADLAFNFLVFPVGDRVAILYPGQTVDGPESNRNADVNEVFPAAP